MATISSPGIGSGLDIKSIVSQLVALEKLPLTKLDVQTATTQTRISAFAQIKSLVSPLSDAASQLNSLVTWNAVSTSSTNSQAVSATAIGGTAPISFNVGVQNLAKNQQTTSAPVSPVGGAIGSGTLTLSVGTWSAPRVFSPGTQTPVDIAVSATDTLTDVASKINGANAGVTAAVVTGTLGEYLMLTSQATGAANGFSLTVADSDGNNSDTVGLSRLANANATTTQPGTDANATINGLAVSSATNTFTNVVSGVTLTVGAVTTTDATVTVAKNTGAITAGISGFVDAYNTLNDALNELTKYDPANKAAGILQGDSTAIGLQNAMRGILQSTTKGSAFSRLADLGITQQLGGALAVDSTKLNAALDTKLADVKSLFRVDNSNTLTNGVALKFKTFSQGLLATDGMFVSKDASLKRSLDLTAKEKTRLNEKVARVEAALNRRYSALDAQISSLNALNAYVTQQVTTWNKSTA